MTYSEDTSIASNSAPTPKSTAFKHIQNFGESGVFFALSLGLSLATAYFRSLEPLLALVYVIIIIYSVLTFENAPKSAFFRFAAITLGVSMGIRELLVLFWIPVVTAILVVVAVGILGYLAYRYFELMLSGGRPHGQR